MTDSKGKSPLDRSPDTCYPGTVDTPSRPPKTVTQLTSPLQPEIDTKKLFSKTPFSKNWRKVGQKGIHNQYQSENWHRRDEAVTLHFGLKDSDNKKQRYCPVAEKLIREDRNRALVFSTGTLTLTGKHIQDCSSCQQLISSHIEKLNAPKVKQEKKVVFKSIGKIFLRNRKNASYRGGRLKSL